MLDLVLGEGVSVKYIRTVEMADKSDKRMIALSQLKKSILKRQ